MSSLFERLGGTDGITAIASDIVDLHLANPRIAPRYQASDVPAVKHAVATFFITGAGGPDVYKGKDMLAAHQGMNIDEAELVAAIDDAMADIAVVESRPQTFYLGTATGGLWRTDNHGTSWTPLFDDQPTSSIGAVTVHQANPNLVWVGTGEPQNRQSSPWGNGVYKSTDAGSTWTHMGLERTKHIGRDIMASFKNIFGGELKGYTELLGEARQEAVRRMTEQAEAIGANAVVNVRFQTSSVAQGAAELFAYGTAVRVE